MTEQLKADAKALFEREGGLDHLIVTPEVAGYGSQLFYPRDRAYALNLVGGDATRLTTLTREDVLSEAPKPESSHTTDAPPADQNDTDAPQPAKDGDEPPATEPTTGSKATKKANQAGR